MASFVITTAVITVLLFTLVNIARAQIDTAAPPSNLSNQFCPVFTDEATEPQIWVDYQGERVYFCCNKCKRLFKHAPELYTKNLPQFAVATVTTNASDGHVDGHPEETRAVQSVRHEDAHAAAPESHDHAQHETAEKRSGVKRVFVWLGNFHPPSTDFPIALLISSALAEILFVMTRQNRFDSAARFCVWLGATSTVVAVALGWFFAGFRWVDTDGLMTLHRWLGTGAGAFAVILLILNVAAHQRDDHGRKWLLWYRVALFTSAIAVATNGFFGGAMIYGLDHYAW